MSDDENGNAFGCKVTLEILHPEMIILADEVGCNTSQKGDGHVGGETFMCGKEKVPKKSKQKR